MSKSETSPTEWLQCCGGVVIAVIVFKIVAEIIAAFLWLTAALTIIIAVITFIKNLFTGKNVFNKNDENGGAE